MQPVTQLADLDHQRPAPGDAAPPFLRVAVLCRPAGQGPRWSSAAGDALARSLVDEALTHFEYFPVDFSDPQCEMPIRQAFAQVQASIVGNATADGASGHAMHHDTHHAHDGHDGHDDTPDAARHAQDGRDGQAHRQQPFDAIVIAGGADIDSDIGMIHRTLVPCMQAASVPVLCALGPDDASTILADSAWRVFPDPLRLLGAIADAVRPAGASPEAVCEQIRSLAGFLVTEQEIELRILRDAAIVPAVQRHFDRHRHDFDAASDCAARAVAHLQTRLLHDADRLDRSRARIGVALAQAQQRREGRSVRGLGLLRLAALALFIGVVAVLWWLTTPASTVFFGGCALVLLSAAYVGIGNIITDRDTGFIREGHRS